MEFSLVKRPDEDLQQIGNGRVVHLGSRIMTAEHRMKATQLLNNMGQSLWLDNITRDLLDTGTLQHYIDHFSVTGLTSNPTIFEHAVKNSRAYEAPIQERLAR